MNQMQNGEKEDAELRSNGNLHEVPCVMNSEHEATGEHKLNAAGEHKLNAAGEHKLNAAGEHKLNAAGQFSNPVYQQISLRNGEINRMTKPQIKDKLTELRLDTRGIKEVMKKRLKNYYKRQKLVKAHIKPASSSDIYYDYLLVIDFEATCQEFNAANFKHEIIEFPIVLVDPVKLEIVDSFHSYCCPKLNPTLSEFCTKLTGISQAMVKNAPQFSEVLDKVNQWIEKHNLRRKGTKFALVSDGPWDFSRFLYTQCLLSRLSYPKWARKWINIRKSYSNYYGCQRNNLATMLENLGLIFEGRPHCGLDDATNIARIVVRLLQDGAELRINECLFSKKIQKLKENEHGEAEVFKLTKEEAEDSVSHDSSSESEISVDIPKNNSRLGIGSEICDHSDSAQGQVETLAQTMDKLQLGLCKDSSNVSMGGTLEQEDMDDLMNYYSLQSS